MRIDVVIAYPDEVQAVTLELDEGATVEEALSVSGFGERLKTGEATGVAVFGHQVQQEFVLHDGDRVELLRPLKRDPRDARRELASKGLDITKPA